MHKHTEHVYIWIFLWIMYEYCRVIYQSFGCIDMLSLCIYESFELLIVNVGYEYERVLWTWVWYECLPFLLCLCVNLLVCLLWGIKRRSLIKVMLCPIYVFPSNHIIYIYIINIIVYFIETYIYIIKTSHVLLTYKSKCLTEVGKENPGCFWLTGKENPGDCVQKLAKILRTNLIITRSFLFWAIDR